MSMKGSKMNKVIMSLLMGVLIVSGCSSNASYTGEKPAATEAKSVAKEDSQSISYAVAPTENEDMAFEDGMIPSNGARDSNTEEYSEIKENEFLYTVTAPLSTFSIDVDTASYSNVRRFINENTMPNPDAVRIEELINYFNYNYQQPTDGNPFSVTMQMGGCPWNDEHYIAMIGLKGKEIDKSRLPKSNLVFLLDVSGSMDEPDKLPLLKEAFKLLVNELTENDRVSIVVYAGASGAVLRGARGDQKQLIISALDELDAGGSTAGAEGIELAYNIAKEHYIQGGNNRVILATDGDFNVGISSEHELQNLIEKKRKEGVFLSVLGFGTGNIKDNIMETLANKGNGNYAYIDSIKEAEKVFVSEMSGTLVTIAKDVKIQVEFNPKFVKGYKLIGYENRKLNNEDFANDKKDAGEMGSGHTVTALYEIIPADGQSGESDLRYSSTEIKDNNDEFMFTKIRYKKPNSNESELIQFVMNRGNTENNNSDFQFATAVAEFGLLLRDSEHKGTASYNSVINRAQKALGKDMEGYRKEFVELVKKAKRMDD